MRLIDANALKNAILAEPWKDQPNMVRLTVDYINIINDEQPTIDAVPVVRCRDCGNACQGMFNLVCVSWGSCADPDGWCYKWNRKDGGTDG